MIGKREKGSLQFRFFFLPVQFMDQVFCFNVVEYLNFVKDKGVYLIGSQQNVERMAALITCQREWQLCSGECR